MTFFKAVFILILLYLAFRAISRIVAAMLADSKARDRETLHGAAANGKDDSVNRPPLWEEEVEEARFRDI